MQTTLDLLDLTHPEIQAWLEDYDEEKRTAAIQRALEVGCTVLRRAETAEHADYLDRRIEHTVQQVQSAFDGLSDQLEQQLLWETDCDSPLRHMHDSLRSEIQGLRDSVTRQQAIDEVIQQTTLKGEAFEAEMWSQLQSIAKPFGDTVLDTRTTAEAVSGSKKGDFVYESPGTGRIVLDAKNYNKLGSLPGMLAYIKEAMLQRTCGFGIIVAPDSSCLQKQVGEWNVYEDRIITSIDHLQLSIRYAKFVMDFKERAGAGDATRIQEQLAIVRRTMKDFTSWKSKLTKLQNGVASSVEDLKSSMDSAKSQIEQALQTAEQAIATK